MKRPLLPWFLIVLAAFLVAACAALRGFRVDDLCPSDQMPVFDREGGFRCVPRVPSPSPSPSATATPAPSPTPSVEPTPQPTPSPSPSVTPSPSPTPAPTPTPAPCVPEPPVPEGPVDVRPGLKPSSCAEPGENSKCFKGGAGGDGVPWEADENACWPAAVVADQANRAPMVLGGLAMMCEPGYLSDPDDTARGCFDAYGRRMKWDGMRWVEQVLHDRFSGLWLGICPPRAPKTCEPTPSPTTTPGPGSSCSLPAMPECGSVGNVDPAIGLYGCCVTDQHPTFPPASPFSGVLEEIQDAEERDQSVPRDHDGRVDEDAYVNEILRRLAARGICAKRGGPSDEIGIKASNGENWQFDIHLGNGRPRRHGYVAYCRPARW